MSFFDRLQKYLLFLGIPGLLAVSFLDGAAVPLVGGPDAIVLLLSWQKPNQWLLIILAAAVGSTLGCTILYNVGRVGGDLALTKFKSEKREWVKGKLDKNAFGAVLMAVLAPPPFPTKLFILAAGAFRISLVKFVNGILAGRLLRYSLLAYLGARFGDHAASVIEDHYPVLFLVLGGLLAAVFLFRRFRREVPASHRNE